MLKNILVGIFAAVLVVAIGTAIYNVIGASAADGSTYVSGNGNGGNGQDGSEVTGSDNGSGSDVSVLDIPAGNGNGYQGGQANAGNGTGIPQPQANIVGAATIHGTVSAYQYGTLTIQTDDGQVVGVQLGNQNFASTLGFAPQIGEGVTVHGFPGDQGLFSAITVTLDGTGEVFTFREATGRPAWAGGNGKGGNNP